MDLHHGVRSSARTQPSTRSETDPPPSLGTGPHELEANQLH